MHGYRCEYCAGTVRPHLVERDSFKHKSGFIIPEDVTVGNGYYSADSLHAVQELVTGKSMPDKTEAVPVAHLKVARTAPDTRARPIASTIRFDDRRGSSRTGYRGREPRSIEGSQRSVLESPTVSPYTPRMAIPTTKAAYALDVECIRALQYLARRLGCR
jgi:hypothetical protein